MLNVFIGSFINCLFQFPYWKELITFVVSVATSVVSSKMAAKSELLKTYREKRVATYDDLIYFLDSFRQDPGLALKDDFYCRSLAMSNHARVYGAPSVVKAMRTMMDSLNRDYESYKRDSDELYKNHAYISAYWPDSAEEPPEYSEQLDDFDSYERQEDKLRKRYLKTEGEAFELAKPVLDAIHDSVYLGKGEREMELVIVLKRWKSRFSDKAHSFRCGKDLK